MLFLHLDFRREGIWCYLVGDPLHARTQFIHSETYVLHCSIVCCEHTVVRGARVYPALEFSYP